MTGQELIKSIVNGLYHFIQDPGVRKQIYGIELLTLEMAKREAAATADYIYAMCPEGIMQFPTRERLFEYALPKTGDGIFLEFGVYKGASINLTAIIMERLGRSPRIFGFDAFEGIDEDMVGTDLPKGGLTCGGQAPAVHRFVTLIKGWFTQTLPVFAREQPSGKAAFIHVDSDTYASTREIFRNCGHMVQEGTIIIFDEYWNYPFWKLNEHKAWREFVEETGLTYRYIGHSGLQVAVQVLSRS